MSAVSVSGRNVPIALPEAPKSERVPPVTAQRKPAARPEG